MQLYTSPGSTGTGIAKVSVCQIYQQHKTVLIGVNTACLYSGCGIGRVLKNGNEAIYKSSSTGLFSILIDGACYIQPLCPDTQ
jgi:hypothetical protein